MLLSAEEERGFTEEACLERGGGQGEGKEGKQWTHKVGMFHWPTLGGLLGNNAN